MFVLMTLTTATPADDPDAAARRRSQLASLKQLRDHGMVLATSITPDYRGDPILAFTRISRCIRLIIFLETAVAEGRLIGPVRAGVGEDAAEAVGSLAAEAAESSGAEETADNAGETEHGERSERENLSGEGRGEMRAFGRWLDRPLDEVIAHISREFGMVERRMAPVVAAAGLDAGETPPPSPLRAALAPVPLHSKRSQFPPTPSPRESG
jgi:hypothetical protein